MDIESISSITSLGNISTGVLQKTTELNNGSSFSDVISNYYNQVNDQINQADLKLREFSVGESTNIHDLLISIEKAKTSFELGLQIRNRLMEGYQELMRMQV